MNTFIIHFLIYCSHWRKYLRFVVFFFIWESVEASEKIPIEHFFQERLASNMTLSPDGKYVAFIAPDRDMKAVYMRDLETAQTTGLRGGPTQDVVDVQWAGNERIIFTVVRNNIFANGLYSVKRGSKRTSIVSNGGVLKIIDPLINEPNHALVWTITENGPGLRKYDLVAGTAKSANNDVHSKGEVLNWRTNSKGDLIGKELYRDGKQVLMHRSAIDEPWVVVDPSLETDLVSFRSLGFHEEKNAYWIVGHKEGVQTASLYLYNLETKSLSEPVFNDSRYDIWGYCKLIYNSMGDRALGLSYYAKSRKIIWFDEVRKSLQVTLDHNFSDTINLIIDSNHEEERFLVYSYSDRNPGVYRVYDAKENRIVITSNARPWIRPEYMASQLTLELTMRDGLKLEGYVTLPGPQDAGPYPMVTLVHGGPWARDRWGFEPVTQFLANRGYAVLQLNFRGSSGYTREISEQHSGDFKGMVEDLSEATRKLVDGGIADPKRLAIMGGSFGGYASVASAAFDPDLYKCAISLSGTFDIEKQINDWKNRFWKLRQGIAAYDYWVDRVGDPEKEADYIRSISPIHFVDEIRIPIMLVHGKSDRVVSHTQSKKLAQALTKVGNKPQTLFMEWQSHGLADLKSRIKVYSQIEEFLARHLSPKG